MSARILKSRTTLGVRDVPRSVAFYGEALGFQVQTSMGTPPTFAVLVRDDISLGLVQTAQPAVATFACSYWNVTQVEALHTRCVQAAATIANPLTRQPWGNYDFVVQDPDGHLIALGEVPSADH